MHRLRKINPYVVPSMRMFGKQCPSQYHLKYCSHTMNGYHSEPAYRYFSEFFQTTTPIVPMLGYATSKRQSTKELGIFYYSHKQHVTKQMFNAPFAQLILKNLTEFEIGKQNGIIAGIVRPSLPQQREKWQGDTILRLDQTPYSVYNGIINIVGENDGLPVVCATNSQVIGDIVPGIKLKLQGKRPSTIYQAIKQLEFIQNKITEIIGSKPFTSAKHPLHNTDCAPKNFLAAVGSN